MEVVWRVVTLQGIVLSVQGEASATDAACHPAYHCPEVRVGREVILQIVEP
jgi:hypothetical protein